MVAGSQLVPAFPHRRAQQEAAELDAVQHMQELALIATPEESGRAARHLARRDAELTRRRAAQEQHHHKQVWAKQFHQPNGGYYPVQAKQAHSASQQLVPAGTAGSDATGQELGWQTWGYEQVKVGRTTNIVGDAMSQLAVDLVHTRLSGGSAPHPSTGPTQSVPRPDPPAAQAPTPGAAGPGRQGHKHAGGLTTEPLPGRQFAGRAGVQQGHSQAAQEQHDCEQAAPLPHSQQQGPQQGPQQGQQQGQQQQQQEPVVVAGVHSQAPSCCEGRVASNGQGVAAGGQAAARFQAVWARLEQRGLTPPVNPQPA
ncbi:hypothetical protein V8C86DRAFT_586633 [Haematococcus lacustris]